MRPMRIGRTADHTRRCSDVMPPESALSFAAIWDPEEGLVTFSGPELLNPDCWDGYPTRNVPWDATEARSQILSIDRFSLPFSNTMDATSCSRGHRVQFSASALDEGQSVLDPYMRYFEARRRMQERMMDPEKSRRRVGHIDWSHLRNASSVMASLGSRILRPFTIAAPDYESEHTYEGLFEEVPVTARTSISAPMLVHLNLKSSFSVTTTSTTGYVDVDTPSEYSLGDSETWDTLGDAGSQSCPNKPIDTRRRLRKPRPVPAEAIPARPAEVLARSGFNHTASQTGHTLRPAQSFAKGLRKLASLPKINVKRPRTFSSPSPTSSMGTEKMLPPAPPLPVLPNSPALGGCSRTLKNQKSMTKIVRENVAKLTQCHPKIPVAPKCEYYAENVYW